MQYKVFTANDKMWLKLLSFISIIFFQGGLCLQKECEEYVEGFYLDEGYNKNVPPQENVTIFDLQHIRDIVEVRLRLDNKIHF